MKVYLDYNSTTPVHPKVKEAIMNALELYGNPSSSYELGRRTKLALENSRNEIAELIGTEASHIYFTGSGTEANNTVIKGVFNNDRFVQKGNHIITSAIEHPSILAPCQTLKDLGFQVSTIGVDSFGQINLDELKKAITPHTKLISIMLANNEIGTIQPIKQICEVAKKHKILVHSDATQALGKIPIDVKDLAVDFLSLSAHKIYGTKGIGVLYAKKSKYIKPLIEGGGHENELRAGTENSLGIIAFGWAAKMLKADMKEDIQRIQSLRDFLEQEILKQIPNCKLNGHPELRLPNTTNISFLGIEGKAILLNLDLKGISVSTSSACKSQSTDPSHVITALGEAEETAYSSVRFSLGRETTKKELDYLLKVLPEVIIELRKLK